MASSFRYFRKHSKVFMAVAAVLCMLIFVVGDALMGSGQGGGEGADAPVATWNGGSINQGQLQAQIAHRLITDEFLKRLFAQGGGQSEYDLPLDIPTRGILLSTADRDQIDQMVIQTEVEADLAKKAGITVSDDLISDYIEKLSLGNLSGEQIEQVLASVGNGNPRTSEGIVMGTLRKLLAAHLYTRMYADPALVMLPHQRWQDWKQVNEQITLQAAVLPVEKFLAEVPQPTEEELKALYNDFKDYDPGRRVDVGGRVLNSPDPGFAEPRRVRLQYLKGSVAELTEKMLDKVSDADIAYYYEQNKETDFLKMEAPANPTPPADEPTEPAAPPTDPEATEDAAGEPADDTTSDEAPSTAPAEEQPATEPAAETPATETPANESAAPSAEGEPASEAEAVESTDGEQSSAAERSSPFRLVSFQEESAAPAEDAEAPAEDAPASEESQVTDEPATADVPAAENEAAESAPATPAAEAAPASTPAAAASDQYEPLENVRDEIRRTLARDLAIKELDRIMGEAIAQLQTAYNAYGIAAVEAEEAGKKAPKPPAKLADLQWLADKNGLTYEKTSLLTPSELYDTPVGKAVGTTQDIPVAQAATTLKLYEPFMASELDDVVYVVMKTEDVPRRIPEFDEVRDQVATAWKQREAAKLAEKKAKELAAEIQKTNTPFDQFFFADRGFEVINETALFSWLNYPAGRAGFGTPPMLSDVPELKSIGPEFMEAAFDLEGQETVGLLNHDHSAAYVIRLARQQWSDEDLKRLFLEESESWLGGRDMLFKHASRFNSAVQEDMFTQRAGLKFDEKWLEERQKRQQR